MILYSGDSLAVINTAQLKAVNILNIDRDFCYEKLSLYEMQLKLEQNKLTEMERMVKKLDLYLNDTEKQLDEQREVVLERDIHILRLERKVKNRNIVIVTMSAILLTSLIVK